MRAVNLIPAEVRKGAGGTGGRSGGAVYVLLGGLALLTVLVAAYALAGKSVNDKKAQLGRVTHDAEVAEAKAQSLSDYTRFASLRTRRVETVSQLAASRFDWAHALHEVARTLPTNAWLTEMTGTTSPTVNVGGGSPLRAALPVPALEITGCTTSQRSVAKMMAHMRLIDGVERVSLADSDKGAEHVGTSALNGSSGGANNGDCRGNSGHFPMFSIVVFFTPRAVTPPAVNGATQTAAAVSGASSTTPASTSAPAAGTAPTAPASGGSTP